MTDFEKYIQCLDSIGAKYTIADHVAYKNYAIAYNKRGRDIRAVEVGKVVQHDTQGGYTGFGSEAWFADDGSFICFAAWE